MRWPVDLKRLVTISICLVYFHSIFSSLQYDLLDCVLLSFSRLVLPSQFPAIRILFALLPTATLPCLPLHPPILNLLLWCVSLPQDRLCFFTFRTVFRGPRVLLQYDGLRRHRLSYRRDFRQITVMPQQQV